MSEFIPPLNIARSLAVWTGVAAIYVVIVELITASTTFTDGDLGDDLRSDEICDGIEAFIRELEGRPIAIR